MSDPRIQSQYEVNALHTARERYWKAAASDNGVSYQAEGDVLTVHDPSIMETGQAVRFDIRDVFHIGGLKL